MRNRKKQNKPLESGQNKSLRNEHSKEMKAPLSDAEKPEELFFGEKLFRTGVGILTFVFLISSFVLTTSTSQEAGAEEIKNRSSTTIESGFTLNEDMDIDLDPRDFEVSGFDDSGHARMLIWDFKGTSENEIQIIVDGQVLREVHILSSNVAAYSVPVPSVVTIRGLNSDGGQPITYAVKFPDRKHTLFNVVPVNGANQFTLVPGL